MQPGCPTVQETINEALSAMFRQSINIVGAGRTDAGVHARQMVAHFDLDHSIQDPDLMVDRLNKMLHPHIAFYNLFPVADKAHARFDANQRDYAYHLHRQRDPFLYGYSVYAGYDLSVDAMNAAAKHLLGEHDFGAFSKSRTQVKTNLCTVKEAYWEQQAHRLTFHISANRFLRNMVRAVVGSLLEVGRGRWSVDQFQTVIASKDRRKAGTSVPPEGLYLTKISYPEKIDHGRLR